MDPVTKNRLIPLIVLILAILLLVPMFVAVNLNSIPRQFEAAGNRPFDCPAGTAPKFVCTTNAETRRPNCGWRCELLPPDVPAEIPPVSIPTVVSCPDVENCPLDCILVTAPNGCEICRCDIRGVHN